ncbi:hypothetical protein ABPG75_005186 [Micractinium tetrahymenae]
MWASASDWALRRLLKVLLKRNLKGVLETEIDVEQLRVSLGTGALELTDVLVSRDWLAERAPPGLEVVSGYIGRLRLELAVTSLTCSVALEDVLVTVRPAANPGSSKGAGAGAAPAPQADAMPAAPAAPAGFGIDEGVRLVAAGVETLLQRMTVTVTRLSVRAELGPMASGGPAATLSCAQLTYGAAQDCHAAEADATTARRVTFSGLSLGLSLGMAGDPAAAAAAAAAAAPAPSVVSLLAPLGGEVEVAVSWAVGHLPSHPPHVSLAAKLEALQVELRPPDVAGLLVLARGFADAHAAAEAAAAELPTPTGAQAAQAALAAAAGHHSFIEDLMLPECEALVQDALAESMAATAITGQEDVDEFFDAKSLLGSLQQAFSSAMASSYVSAGGGGPGSSPGGADLDVFAMHDLAASVREVGGERGKAWTASLAAPSLTLCLLYPEEAGCSSAHFAPRLVVEVADLALAAESASAGTDAASHAGAGSSCSITAGVLEVAEHLPFPSRPSPASSVASLSSCCVWLPAEEMARVPAVLPAVQHLRWPVPTSAGDYPLPEPASVLGIGDTLAQLSGLSQATVYQSAAMAESSMLQSTMACQEAAAVPRVQVVPVLLCSGQDTALVLHCSQPAEEAAALGPEVSLLLQPVCLCPPSSQQAKPRGGGVSLRLSMYLPGACLVLDVPSASKPLADAAAPQPKYFLVGVQGSSSHLLASMGPSMGTQQAQALVASLHESGVEPTVVLQPGGSLGSSGSSPASERSWSCCLRTGPVAVHAAGDAGAEPELGDSVLGSALAAAPVATIEAGAPLQPGLSIDLCWRQLGAAPPGDLLDSLWASASRDPGCQPGPAALWQQLSGVAPLLACVRLGAPALVTLERGTLAAAGRLVDGLLQLSAAPPPAEPATPAALQLECEVQCSLVGLQGAALATLSARSIHAVAGSSLGGLAGSSVVAAAVSSAELARPEGGPKGSHLLAHVAGQQQADGRRLPAAQLFAVLRPSGEPCMLSSAGRYVLPCRGRLALCAAGATVLLDEAGRLGWAADLHAFLASSGSPAPAAAVPAAAAPLPSPPSPSPSTSLDCALRLLSSSVRYEPADPRLAAAVLTVASLAWRAQQGQPSAVEARRLALHVAAASGSGSRASGSLGKAAQQQGAQVSLADVAGFHQVAAEAEIRVRLPGSPAAGAPAAAEAAGQDQGQAPPAAGWSQQQEQQQQQQQQQQVREVVVTNRGLTITLSRHTLLLLQRLVRQLPSQGSRCGSGSGSSDVNSTRAWGREPGAAASSCPEWSVSSAAGMGSAGSGRSGQPGASVDVMRGVVPAAYASPARSAEHPLEASVFLDGGWYDPHTAEGQSRYSMSPAGSPPAMVGDDFLRGGPDRAGAAQEGQGRWYGASGAAPPLELQEDYVALQVPSEEEAAASPGSPSYDCRVLPPDHPAPLRRLSLQDVSITVTLADTFTTVLLPEEEGSSDELEFELAQSPRWRGQRGGNSSTGFRAAAQRGGEDEEEVVVPLSAQVQARLEGVCLQLDTFSAAEASQDAAMHEVTWQATGEQCGSCAAAAAASALHSRWALLVRTLEVRDSFQPRKGGGESGAAAAAAAATGWAGLRRMLGYHASVHRVRPPKASQVQLVVEAVQAEPGADLEYRLHVQLLPLLLHLDQAALAFLQHFFTPEDTSSDSGSDSSVQAVGAHAADTCPAPGLEPFFQRCEVQPFMLTINYRPHRVDLAALSSGQLAEVLNLVPWGGVSLQFRHLRLFGMQGIGGVGTALASAYMEDIARFQAHRFVSGIAPIASICRVSSAAAQLVAIPRQQLYKHSSGSVGGLTLSALADEDFRRQMQRGLAGFVRAVALEAITLGATVAAGAEVALAGESSASHTAGVKQALWQASAHLRSSTSGPRTAASAAATAVRTALLGVRNTLDKEHAIERRLNS